MIARTEPATSMQSPRVDTQPTTVGLSVADAQRDVRTVYAGGFHGQLVSAGVWFIAGVVSATASHTAGIFTLLLGGTLIFPITILTLRLRGGPSALPDGHPMASLATQVAFTVPLGLLVALAAAGYREEWFFPASMVIVGAHYLPFTFLYGMSLFTALATALVGAGLAVALWLPDSFSTGAFVAAAVLTYFAFLLRRAHDRTDRRPPP